MSRTTHAFVLASLLLAGCATVRSEDLAAWRGRPVANLDKHPMFATMRMTRTYAADGTEIRNYANGTAHTACAGGGFVHSHAPGMANVSQHANCAPRARVEALLYQAALSAHPSWVQKENAWAPGFVDWECKDPNAPVTPAALIEWFEINHPGEAKRIAAAEAAGA
jgi:hypothetical protein